MGKKTEYVKIMMDSDLKESIEHYSKISGIGNMSAFFRAAAQEKIDSIRRGKNV